MNVFTIMRISSQVPGQRDKASNLKAEDVILCCLIRAIARRDGEKQMTIEQWWTGDYQWATRYKLGDKSAAMTFCPKSQVNSSGMELETSK